MQVWGEFRPLFLGEFEMLAQFFKRLGYIGAGRILADLQRHADQRLGIDVLRRESIEAVSGDETVPVPPLLVQQRPADHYVLQVTGESMIEDQIADGDSRRTTGPPLVP